MTIKILIDPPKNVRPDGAIRADVAWKLFLPDFMGDLPKTGMHRIRKLRHWLWGELGEKLGYMKVNAADSVYILTPELSAAGKEFLIRTCSLWDDEVVTVQGKNGEYDIGKSSENLWTAPVVNVNKPPEDGSALSYLHESLVEGSHTFFSPILGATKSFVRAYTIAEGNTYSRFHSHTVREELYLILNGNGTLRVSGHRTAVTEGDLISKPLGPDISTQFLADRGEALRVLDIEIWPDDEKRTKEVVGYPDHGELLFSGTGWDIIAPSDSLMDLEDSMKNYDAGYRRNRDGSWTPADVPGVKKREK